MFYLSVSAQNDSSKNHRKFIEIQDGVNAAKQKRTKSDQYNEISGRIFNFRLKNVSTNDLIKCSNDAKTPFHFVA